MLSCNYNEIMHDTANASRCGGASKEELLLLLLELAVKKREVSIGSFLLEKDEEREDRRMVPRYDGIHRD